MYSSLPIPQLFQSTPPVKAATLLDAFEGNVRIISIHAAREGGDAIAILPSATSSISIHAAREGGDCPFNKTYPCLAYFNPRRP